MDWVAIIGVIGTCFAAINDISQILLHPGSRNGNLRPLDRWSFLGYWVLLTSTGWSFNGLIDEDAPVQIFIGGIVVGLLQWVALQRNVNRALLWVPPTALGWYVSWEVIKANMGSIVLALFQYVILLTVILKVSRFTRWIWLGLFIWILATSIGWFLGWELSDAVSKFLDTYMFGEFLGGALNGMITGIVMFYLLRVLTPSNQSNT
jgi:hypothetical protein